jgi:hypothetical protein
MSTTSSQEDVAVLVSFAKPNLNSASPTSGWSMASQVEETQGLLRAASDGRIIEEDTGDLVHLDVPDDEAQQYYTEVNEHAASRRYYIPEVKNGSTALDNSRTRKPITRVLKNWITGSSRPPSDKPHWVFGNARYGKPGKVMLGSMIETRRHQGGADVRHTMIKIMKSFWNKELTESFGREWAKKANDEDEVMVQMEDFVMGLVVSNPKQPEERNREAEESAAKATPEASKKRGWFW